MEKLLEEFLEVPGGTHCGVLGRMSEKKTAGIFGEIQEDFSKESLQEFREETLG